MSPWVPLVKAPPTPSPEKEMPCWPKALSAAPGAVVAQSIGSMELAVV